MDAMRQATELQRRLDEYNEGVMEREIANLRAKDMALVALTQAMTAELDALRAKWNAVPWDALLIVKWRVACYLPESLEARYNAFSTWLAANAPEEAAK
jgi:hypothetical protein